MLECLQGYSNPFSGFSYHYKPLPYIELKYGSVCDIYQSASVWRFGLYHNNIYLWQRFNSLKTSDILIFLPQRQLLTTWRQPYFPRAFWLALLWTGWLPCVVQAVIPEYPFRLGIPFTAPMFCFLFSAFHSCLSWFTSHFTGTHFLVALWGGVHF